MNQETDTPVIPQPKHFPASLKDFYQRIVKAKYSADSEPRFKQFTESFCDRAAVDAAAAGLIADLQNAGVRAEGAKGRVLDGIAAIQNRLKVCGDGRPRLTVSPGCPNVINEFESYEWQAEKDAPQKENDHAMDALRYLSALLSEPSGDLTESSARRILKDNPHLKNESFATPEFTRDSAPYRITPATAGQTFSGARDLSRTASKFWRPRHL
jgi:hypothetical protein